MVSKISKLTKSDIYAELQKRQLSQREIAAKFQVSRMTVFRINRQLRLATGMKKYTVKRVAAWPPRKKALPKNKDGRCSSNGVIKMAIPPPPPPKNAGRKTIKQYETLDFLVHRCFLRASPFVRIDTKVLKKLSLAVGQRLELARFKASNNWIANFKKRFGIRLRDLNRAGRTKAERADSPTWEGLSPDEVVDKSVDNVFREFGLGRGAASLIKMEKLRQTAPGLVKRESGIVVKNEKGRLPFESQYGKQNGGPRRKFRRASQSLEEMFKDFEQAVASSAPALVKRFAKFRRDVYSVVEQFDK
ncbi:hypothetical protein MHBO_002499 [Bonamia ostreae]|uniref:HTH CENPB-type domain-containing protein n=1 Tax=Bonamia ostreae TaxID=126728 RepID=A0ABV2AMK9_9EUKA